MKTSSIAIITQNNLPGDLVRFFPGGVEKVGTIYSSKNSTVSDGIWFEIEVRNEETGHSQYYKQFIGRAPVISKTSKVGDRVRFRPAPGADEFVGTIEFSENSFFFGGTYFRIVRDTDGNRIRVLVPN